MIYQYLSLNIRVVRNAFYLTELSETVMLRCGWELLIW